MANAKPDPATYRQQLEEICSQLATCAERTAVRGSGMAQFAWAESGNRSVCLSRYEGAISVELWEGDREAEEAIHPVLEVGVEVAQRWLCGAAGAA